MNCCEFREKHSDYSDGLLSPAEHSEAGAHLAACTACRRFDAALRAGLDALRALPRVGVSSAFGARLRRRLRGEFAVRVPVIARWSGAVGTLLLVATVGVIGWDLLESRAAHHGRVGWSSTGWSRASTTVAAAGTVPSYPMPRLVSLDPRVEAFHPMNSILIVEDTFPFTGVAPRRYDVPAVWGGP